MAEVHIQTYSFHFLFRHFTTSYSLDVKLLMTNGRFKTEAFFVSGQRTVFQGQ